MPRCRTHDRDDTLLHTLVLLLPTYQELWLDFIADTGDGGNPTYAVARALAAPELLVPVTTTTTSSSNHGSSASAGAPTAAGGRGGSSRVSTGSSSILEGARKSGVCQAGRLELPRGEVLLIGGDLAYPNPSRETFEQRLFVPFQEAMPPPPHYHPGAKWGCCVCSLIALQCCFFGAVDCAGSWRLPLARASLPFAAQAQHWFGGLSPSVRVSVGGFT